MNIVVGGDQYPEYINGAATFTERLVRGLAHRGHRMTVVWPSADGAPRSHVLDGVEVHRLRSFRWPRTNGFRVAGPRTSGPAVAEVVAAAQPDVVHVQSHLLVGRRLARAAVAASLPLVATNHFMPENVLDHAPFVDRSNATVGRWMWRDLAAVYRQADLLTAPTARAVQLLATAAGLSAEAISCGIDLDRFWQPDRPPTSNVVPTVLFVGRLEAEKRIDQLLRAFAALPDSVRARLHIVGTGTQQHQLCALATALGVADRVTFAGRVDAAALAVAYRSCDVFCMPSTAELQSLATLEAMSAGKPVVAADAMALPHLVTDGHNGYLYDPASTEALAGRLATLLSQPALRRRLGHASRARAERHAIGHTLDAFEERYAQLVDRRRHDRVRGVDAARPRSLPVAGQVIRWKERAAA